MRTFPFSFLQVFCHFFIVKAERLPCQGKPQEQGILFVSGKCPAQGGGLREILDSDTVGKEEKTLAVFQRKEQRH